MPTPAIDDKDKIELGRVREAARCLEKTVQAYLLYPPANPLPGEFQRELHAMLTALLAEFGPLTLEARGAELLFKGAVVHRDGGGEGFAAALTRDGVRRLVFSPGLAAEDLEKLLSVVKRAAKERAGDEDLSTLLWKASMSKIACEVVGELEDADERSRERGFWAKVAESERAGGGVESAAAGGTSGEGGEGGGGGEGRGGVAKGGEGTDMAAARILEELSDVSGDLAEFEGCRREAESFDPVASTIGIVSEIIVMEDRPEGIGEACELLDGLYDRFLDRAEFASALRVLEAAAELESVERSPSPVRAQRLAASLRRAAGPAGVSRLRAALDEEPACDLDAARRLLMFLPQDCLPHLIDALGILARVKTRRMVCGVIVERGAAAVDEIGRAISDGRWYVARNAAMILGRIGGPRACAYLAAAAAHPEEPVRREAVEALARMDLPEARSALRAALGDPSPSLRLSALRAVSRGGEDGGFAESRVREAGFRALPADEQQEWLSALARMRGAAAIAVLRPLIEPSFFLNWGARRRLRPLAVLALAEAGGSEAAAYLEELERGGDSSVRSAAQLALERVRRAQKGS